VTLRAPKDDRLLVRDLSLEIPRGRRVLLTGPNGTGKSALFRAAAGLWTKGSGHISRPGAQRVQFLPEQPYMIPGTLRDQFTKAREGSVNEERILSALRKVHLESLPQQIGGLDAERDWGATLSLGEQQLIAFARLFLAEPDFAFLDHAVTALSEPQRAEVYQLLATTAISYISVGDREPSLLGNHDTLLELRPDGCWSAEPIEDKHERPR
jgi:putative ATP-binding cassette transporter